MDLSTKGAWSRAFVGALCVATLVLVACGQVPTSNEAAAGRSGTGKAAFPVTIGAANGPVTLEQRPRRIVSLSATATEMLFAIDAGEQVVAVDDNSNFPREAPMSDLSAFDVNVEAVAGYEPDLVVYSNDPGGLQRALRKLEIPALFAPAAATLDDTYEQIGQLGEATGHPTEASALIDRIRTEVAEVSRSVDEAGEGLTYYYELDTQLFSLTSETFVGELFSSLGLENIADAADEDGTGYPQLSAEYVLEQDPDLIFLADTKCCDQDAATVARRPGWDRLSAVENDAVVELDDDVASRWGPRVVLLLELAAAAIADLEETSA